MGRGRAGWRIEGIRKGKVERQDLLTIQRQLETGNWWRYQTSQMWVLFLQLSLGSGAGVQDCSWQVGGPSAEEVQDQNNAFRGWMGQGRRPSRGKISVEV